MKTSNFALLVLTGALAFTGCKSKDEPESKPPITTAPAGSEEKSEADDDPNKAQVHIDAKVAELCGINADQANFDFDSAKLSTGAKTVLDAIAVCFLSGPGKDHNLAMVGHADPRGTEEY